MIRVVLFGRLTKDPEYKETKNGTKYISFSVAARTGHKIGDEYLTNFVNCKMYGVRADVIAENFQKGDAIVASGKMAMVEYEKDGEQKHYLDMVVDDFEFGFSKKSKEAAGGMAKFGVPINDEAPINF